MTNLGFNGATRETSSEQLFHFTLIIFIIAGVKKFKIHDANDAKGKATYMEEALKSKLEGLEDQGRASKLFSICSIGKGHSREQIGCECWRSATLPPTVALPLLSLVDF
ncbi:hypothetical protein M9H77_35789 [Catharanthus roseus]|uniref:Uncharacterized protein n=1 Tax=Catharanthus roseus TaxID=4058 RepID=A0ACB9ZRQ7_CATRO|nr:hypothetical protein M9H77_35789 [Catharanthus roseus]